MIEGKLLNVRYQLERKEIKLSDALLITARFLNNQLKKKQLTWLNRELLGYLKEDLEGFFNAKDESKFPLPDYRFLRGSWGRECDDGMIIHLETPRLKEKRIFCNIGIQQIETQLLELKEKNSEPMEDNVFCMSFDPATGAQFYCNATELEKIYLSVKQRLLDFIDSACAAKRADLSN